jgi:acetyl esterase
MIGKVYYEHGAPLTILTRWGKGGGSRNVLIRRHDGSEVVRPFRGLRRVAIDAPELTAKGSASLKSVQMIKNSRTD